jgi:hypothetical protein
MPRESSECDVLITICESLQVVFQNRTVYGGLFIGNGVRKPLGPASSQKFSRRELRRFSPSWTSWFPCHDFRVRLPIMRVDAMQLVVRAPSALRAGLRQIGRIPFFFLFAALKGRSFTKCGKAEPNLDTRRRAGCLFFYGAEAARNGNPPGRLGFRSFIPGFAGRRSFRMTFVAPGFCAARLLSRDGLARRTPFFLVWCRVGWDMSCFVLDSPTAIR